MAILVRGGSGGSLHPAMTRPLVDRRDMITGQKLIRMFEFPATAQLSTWSPIWGLQTLQGTARSALTGKKYVLFLWGSKWT